MTRPDDAPLLPVEVALLGVFGLALVVLLVSAIAWAVR